MMATMTPPVVPAMGPSSPSQIKTKPKTMRKMRPAAPF